MKIDGDFIKDDTVTAYVLFEEMNVIDRFKAILYVIDDDNSDVTDKAIKTLLLSYKPYLKAIQKGNNEDFRCNEEGDKKMLKWAEQWLYDNHPEHIPTIDIEPLPIEIAKEKYNNFYLLL